MNSLFPGRDQEAGTDESFDLMLKEAFRSERMPAPPVRVEHKAPPEKTPLPPLLKVYWVLIALLLLLLLAALCNRRQEIPHAGPPATVQPTPASTPSSISPARPVFLPGREPLLSPG
jgi:hypothetical protein